jgi:hypothetical protein
MFWFLVKIKFVGNWSRRRGITQVFPQRTPSKSAAVATALQTWAPLGVVVACQLLHRKTPPKQRLFSW